METGYQTVTAETREQLILEHLPQVRWIAASIHERLADGTSQEDLISIGVLGLIAAVDNYDPSRNASLRTYAEYRIRGAILDSIRGLDGIPPHKRKRLRQVQDAMNAVEQRHKRSAREEEVAEELGISIAEYRTWLDELKGVTLGSLDSVAAEGCDVGLLRYLADESAEPAPVMIERAEMRRLLAEGVAAMPELEQTILDLYFHQELTLAEIGRIMCLHTSRISQLKLQAVIRLRNWLRRRLQPLRKPAANEDN
jgi:RNA polymerase sigma factor for flagellar operon FliA